MSNAFKPASNTTSVATDPHNVVKRSCEEDCCPSENGNKEKALRSDEEDIICFGEKDCICKTSCCSSEEEAVFKDVCQDFCCPGNENIVKDSCCSDDEEEEGEGACRDGCCSSEDETAAIGKPQGDVCSIGNMNTTETICQDGCCYDNSGESSQDDRACCDGRHLAVDALYLVLTTSSFMRRPYCHTGMPK